MRLQEAAWALFALSSCATAAAWWQSAYSWPAAAFSLMGLVALAGEAWLAAREERIAKSVEFRLEQLESRVEALQKVHALQSLR